MVDEIRSDTIRCIKDLNGNHVVQKAIECLNNEAIGFILEAAESQAELLSMHKCGCRVLLRLLEHAPKSKLGTMLDRLMKQIQRLSKDNYGNYVVQHILAHGRVEDIRAIIDFVKSEIILVGKDMCCSHVAEQCFVQIYTGQHKAELVADRRELIK